MTAPQVSAKDKPLHEYPEAAITSSIHAHYGIDTHKFNALVWISDDTVLLSAGKFVLFVNIKTGAISSQQGPADGGVGVVAVHPSCTQYVVGERAPHSPQLRVYDWPSKNLVQSLSDGADVGFSAIGFDASGTRMASVACAPDYMLTVWDWERKAMILRNKCFGSDVDTVLFSPFDNTVLVTGGSGHIKFWSMSQTFTGLKLQGVLGKFGRLEISNVTGFVVLPDGKVISGSESGCILLWEGDLVKCSFVKSIEKDFSDDPSQAPKAQEFTPCHDGTIHAVTLIHGGKVVVTAGDDGYIRYWDREEMDVAEGEGLLPLYVPKCLLEVCVNESLEIRSMTLCTERNEWAVLDSHGVIQSSPCPSMEEIRNGELNEDAPESSVIRFNGGGMTSSAISLNDHTIITGGEDGVVRLLDYVDGSEITHVDWPAVAETGTKTVGSRPKASAVTLLRFFHRDPSQSTFVAGFDDGAIRLLRRNTGNFSVLGQWKPHSEGLFAVAVSKDERHLCSVSRNGTAFFFDVASDFSELFPIGFCRTPLPTPLSAEWDEKEPGGCFIGYEGGQLLSIRAPRMDEMNHDVTFEFTCVYELIGIRQRKLPPVIPEEEQGLDNEEEDILEEKDNGPWAVVILRRLPDDSLAIGMHKEELVYAYHATIRYPNALALPPLPPTGVEPPDYVEEPATNLCYRNLVPRAAMTSPDRKELIVVCEDSKLLIRDLANPQTVSLAGQSHDSTWGSITGAHISFDGSMVVTTGMDGLMVSQLREHHRIKKTEPAPLPQLTASEVVEPTPVLSIQEQKEADDRAKAEHAKQLKMERFLEKVKAIHERYMSVLQVNGSIPEVVQLQGDELELDLSLNDRLEEERQKRVEEVRKEYALEGARQSIRTQKLRNRFVDNLIYDRFLVHAFSHEYSVASFRTPNPAAAIARLENQIRELDSVSEGEVFEEEEPEVSTGNKTVKEHSVMDSDDEKESTPMEAEEYARALRGMSASVRQQLDKLDGRRRERRKRQTGYDRLLQRRPDPQENDLELAKLRKQDLLERGECILRTDPNYKGDADYGPTASAKLRRMIALENFLIEKRTEFNEKLLAVRQTKRDIMTDMNALRGRIAAINAQIGDYTVESSPLSFAPEEEPEKLFSVDREALDEYARRKALERAKEEQAKKAQRGFGADLAQATNANDESEASSPSVLHSKRGSRKQSRQSMVVSSMNRERMDTELRAKLDNIKLSEMEEEEKAMLFAQLRAERGRLVAEARQVTSAFDEKLLTLLYERTAVDADLCLADAHLLLLFREFQMLLVFRKRDKELRRQMNAVRQGREKLRKDMLQLKSTIQLKETTISTLQEKLKENKREAEDYIHVNCPADKVPYILKVFNRYIKRKKNNDEDDDNDDITSDDEDEDVDLEDDIGEEICPENCELAAWEQMLAYREIRLDYTDELTDEKASQEESRRALEHCEKEVENLAIKVKECNQEVADLEIEKRRELNLLNTVVSLRCDQIKCLTEDFKCPTDVHSSDILVVADEELARLKQRITELAQQKHNRRVEIAGMSAELQRLQNDKSDTQKVHAHWESKVFEVMMLKFGRQVDLEMLESCGTSRRIEAKKEELRQVELQWERELRKHERKIAALRHRQQATLLDNTHLLQDYGNYESDRQEIERALRTATSKTVQRYRGARVATKKDRANLRELIAAQQEEMDALNAEIMMLRRKGEHVYSLI